MRYLKIYENKKDLFLKLCDEYLVNIKRYLNIDDLEEFNTDDEIQSILINIHIK